ncbi:hypothetical protein [Microbulbifer sp. THAF38]|uniref:hypothetical protein n=1 Tax=Microbulbifer sp. THAF38 TaxID=2587856 RepID=UPI0012694DA9|nr:hypothetical protein [Microbulbifer sp. THAF38]QFT55664.1 hypothetical protein FIU95_14035 [Microbulbifer sp. THAF38]
MKYFAPKLLTTIAAAGLAFGSATSALAQTDSETTTITLMLMQMDSIDIAFVDPVNINNPVPGMDATADESFCVAGTGSVNNYSITFVNPATTGPQFELTSQSNPGSPPINYEVFFKNNNGPGPGTIPATPNDSIPGNSIEASACNNLTDENAKFTIQIPFPEWDNRENDSPFVGQLMITVEAD